MWTKWFSASKSNRREHALVAMIEVKANVAHLPIPEEILIVRESLRSIMYHVDTGDDDRRLIREVNHHLEAAWYDIIQFCRQAPNSILLKARVTASRDNLVQLKAISHQLLATVCQMTDAFPAQVDRMSPTLEDFSIAIFWQNGSLIPHVKTSDPRLTTLLGTELAKILALEGYVEIDDKYVSLTPKGSEYITELANTYFYRRNVIKRWLLHNSTSGARVLLGWAGSGVMGVLVGQMLG